MAKSKTKQQDPMLQDTNIGSVKEHEDALRGKIDKYFGNLVTMGKQEVKEKK